MDRTKHQLVVRLKEDQPVGNDIVSLLAEVDKARRALKECSNISTYEYGREYNHSAAPFLKLRQHNPKASLKDQKLIQYFKSLKIVIIRRSISHKHPPQSHKQLISRFSLAHVENK